MNKEKIKEIIYTVIDNTNAILPEDQHLNKSTDTKLFGTESPLDSMGLVNFLVDTEAAFLEEDIEISLMSGKAMSRSQSPFRSVQTLIDYIDEEING
jgi:acyl carrier protein